MAGTGRGPGEPQRPDRDVGCATLHANPKSAICRPAPPRPPPAPHRTAPHRTAHRTAPHRTAPHRASLNASLALRGPPHRRDRGARHPGIDTRASTRGHQALPTHIQPPRIAEDSREFPQVRGQESAGHHGKLTFTSKGERQYLDNRVRFWRRHQEVLGL